MMGEGFFRWADRLEAELREKSYKKQQPSTLSEDELISFETSARARRGPLRNQKQIEDILNRKNPVRLSRMRRDFKWCQKQYIKLGLNPEDVRNLF